MDENTLKQLVEDLENENRRTRQVASHEIAQLVETDPESLVSEIPALVEGLSKPEAQTRWELFGVLSQLVRYDAKACKPACAEAEAALFDEDFPKLRLEAFRFLAAYGATSPSASDETWPLLEDAIQCYHGSPEFREMLQATCDFCEGNISKKTREAIEKRAEFDARTSSMPFIKNYAKKILHVLHGTKRV